MNRRAATIVWILVAIMPVAGFWLEGALHFYSTYEGTCGLLDAGWPCTRLQYVKYSMLDALVLPGLVIYSAAWFVVVLVAGIAVRLTRRRLKRRRLTV
jgi:hypothetical protein